MNIKQLRQAKHDKLERAKAIHAAAENEKRLCTKAENEEFDRLMAEVTELNAQIQRVEQLMDEERHAPAAGSAARATERGAEAPWTSLGEQLNAVATAAQSQGRNVNPRLYAALGANETVEAEGGFLVAPEFAQGILERTYDIGEVFPAGFPDAYGIQLAGDERQSMKIAVRMGPGGAASWGTGWLRLAPTRPPNRSTNSCSLRRTS